MEGVTEGRKRKIKAFLMIFEYVLFYKWMIYFELECKRICLLI